MKYQTTEQAEWRHWVTPKDAKEKAVHRWYLFPHSFTDNLVHALIDEWGLNGQDRILDPFVGAGTTLLAAKAMGVRGNGYDLSPLAVLASNTKTATFSRKRLEAAWQNTRTYIDTQQHDTHEPRLSGTDSQGTPRGTT